MDNNGELLAQIGTTEAKRAKLTLGWRGTTTPVPDVIFFEEGAPAVRAVASASPAPALRVDLWMKPGPVDLCLELWKRWMAGDSDCDLGAKTMRGLSGEGDSHGVDLHETSRRTTSGSPRPPTRRLTACRACTCGLSPCVQPGDGVALPECVADGCVRRGARGAVGEAAEKHLHRAAVLILRSHRRTSFALN